MLIKFKKLRLYGNLIMGIFWIALGVFNIVDTNNLRWYDYVYLIVGVLYLVSTLYEYLNHYLKIDSVNIKRNKLYGWKNIIKIDEIITIKKFADEYTLISPNQKLCIHTRLIDKYSLIELKGFLETIKLPKEESK